MRPRPDSVRCTEAAPVGAAIPEYTPPCPPHQTAAAAAPTLYPAKYNNQAKMAPRPDHSDRPGAPRPAPSASAGTPDADALENPSEPADTPQPHDEDGVMEDMATLAVNPRALGQRYNGTVSPTATQNPAHHPGQFAEMEDSAIMLELRAGNMSGFDFLIQKYRKPIVNFMYRMVHNQAVAEELAQEVFLRVYRSRETYRAEARFSTWLYRIATNLGVNYARDTRHERAASTVYLDETDSETGTTPDVADDEPTVEASMLRRERLNAIRQHVLALPERQRMAVLMHKYEGMDYKQIGDVLKLSESATKSLLFRAYQTLREKLKEFI
jgi:RNA polymerase sigma-70 factor (ECF subfamily)